MLQNSFLTMNTVQKMETLNQHGVYLMSRNAGMCSVHLYNYNNTYIEVWKFIGLDVAIRIEPLHGLDELDVYLKNIVFT
jgi:hypothetical protein